MKIKILIFLSLISFCFLYSCNSNETENEDEEKWDYPPAVVWEDTHYYVQDMSKCINKNDIENKIDEITKVIDPSKFPEENREANTFDVGCAIYKIKDVDTKHSIAVEYNDKYYLCEAKEE